ncbi:substrate-binding domain-containing protein [Arthrobacter sp. P2b]|uniref:substrate-binding domain-containing protein n=1 Tax=Arthrobacter sp. P2b TaxID=1938741 RepID=UPI0009A84D6D|nr:substrate-binding domain-containing protein [Arthrobacter sp. P2b]
MKRRDKKITQPRITSPLGLCGIAVLATVLTTTACTAPPPAVSDDALRGSLVGVGNGSMSALVAAWQEGWRGPNPAVSVAFSPDGGTTGIDALAREQTHFATSTMPGSVELPASSGQLCGPSGPLILPAAVLPVGVAYNLPGIRNVKLNAGILSGILLREITRWNDPRIAQENPGLDLPDIEITPLLSDDDQDVTEAVTEYLSKEAGSEWGFGISAEWPESVDVKVDTKPIAIASDLDDTVGGLAVFERGIIGSRFSTASLQFDGTYQSFSPDSVLAAIEAGNTASTAPGALEQELDGKAGYALAVKEYVVLCREYPHVEIAKLVSSWGEAIFSETGQRNANIFASALPPNSKTSDQAKKLIAAIVEGTE